METVPSSDPFPAFVWADSESQAKRLVNEALGGHYSLSQLQTRITLTSAGRNRYVVRGPQVKYDVNKALAEFKRNPTKHRDARAKENK